MEHHSAAPVISPTPAQGWLLRAALMEGEPARQAYARWESMQDVDEIDAASHLLLPLLHRNLTVLGIEAERMGTFKGVIRRSWYENQLLWRGLSPVLNGFETTGIPCLVVGGAALSALYYPEGGLRPLREADLLISAEYASAAAAWLQDHYWLPANRTRETLGRQLDSEIYKTALASQYFRHTTGIALRLHWHPLAQRPIAAVDHLFWEDIVCGEANNLAFRTLNPTVQLLCLCAQAPEALQANPAQWIADAVILLRHMSNVDWAGLIALGKSCKVTGQLGVALTYLREEFQAAIPEQVPQEFKAIPASEIEELETGFAPASEPVQRVMGQYQRYCRSTRITGATHQKVGLPVFLQHLWGLRSTLQIPRYVARATRSAKPWR